MCVAGPSGRVDSCVPNETKLDESINETGGGQSMPTYMYIALQDDDKILVLTIDAHYINALEVR